MDDHSPLTAAIPACFPHAVTLRLQGLHLWSRRAEVFNTALPVVTQMYTSDLATSRVMCRKALHV